MKIHIKTEHHHSKGRRTQIVHTQIGTEEMLAYPPFKLVLNPETQRVERLPNTWERPIIQKRVIHHNI